jgi:MscS family membrane protein
VNRFVTGLLVAAWAVLAQLPAQPPAPPQTERQRQIDDRETPRGSFYGFLQATASGDYRLAASYLDLRGISAARQSSEGPELARKLRYVVDKELRKDPAMLSQAPEGDLADGLPPNQEEIGTVTVDNQQFDLLMERVKRPDLPEMWLVARTTVRSIPMIHSRLSEPAAEKYMPEWLQVRSFLHAARWQWLFLFALTFIVFGAGWMLAHFLLKVFKRLVKSTQTKLDDAILRLLSGPTRLLLSVALYRAGVAWIEPPVMLRSYLNRILTIIVIFTAAWFIARIIDGIAARTTLRLTGRSRASAYSLVSLARRTLTVVVFALAAIGAVKAWGYDTTALLAGVGIGGIAVALAAQKSIENLIGGVSIAADKPVLVGDLCRFGGQLGTVEDIGLRSTRLRTLDRTVVTVPNAQFSELQLENFGQRDKILLAQKLQLRRDTTPAQMRSIISAVRGTLLNHSNVDPEPARVRFTGMGEYSLDVEIFAYISTADYEEFLLIQQDLLLSMMDVVEEAGAAFAVPEQMNTWRPEPGRQHAARQAQSDSG